MVKSVVPMLLSLWMVFVPLLLAEELAGLKSSVCKLCTTYATTYTYLNSTTQQATILTTTIGTTYVYTGTKTVTRHDLTGTLYYSETNYEYEYGAYPLSQNHTKTIHKATCTTTTICAPTTTPSDYPSPTYCDCKKTITSTVGLPVTITTYGTTIKFLTTLTVPPTEYGDNYQSTPYWRVATLPGLLHYNYTKTVYKSTSTVTLPANPTNTDFRTFKLQAIANPSLSTSNSYVRIRQICADPPLCSERPWITSPDGDAAGGTVFTFQNGTLLDTTDGLSCGFYADGNAPLLPFALVCGDDSAPDAWVGHYHIDCFSNLKAYVNYTDTWGIRDIAGGILELYAQPDPVHGYNDYGRNDSPFVDDRPQYVQLRVVPYGL